MSASEFENMMRPALCKANITFVREALLSERLRLDGRELLAFREPHVEYFDAHTDAARDSASVSVVASLSGTSSTTASSSSLSSGGTRVHCSASAKVAPPSFDRPNSGHVLFSVADTSAVSAKAAGANEKTAPRV